jgi:hypothetical protein
LRARQKYRTSLCSWQAPFFRWSFARGDRLKPEKLGGY